MFNDHFYLTSNEKAQFFTFLLQLNSRQTSLEPNKSLQQVYKVSASKIHRFTDRIYVYLSKTAMNEGVRMFPDVS